MNRKIFLLSLVLFIASVIVIVTVFISNYATEYQSLNKLVTELECKGYTIEINDINKNNYLVGKPKMLTINHNLNLNIFVYTYKSSKKMEQVAADISNNYNFYAGLLHFYKMENLIVLYVGADEEIIKNLNEIMGPQFAGYPEQKHY